jgi:hypothetical protein
MHREDVNEALGENCGSVELARVVYLSLLREAKVQHIAERVKELAEKASRMTPPPMEEGAERVEVAK